ncbi:MAG TPA: hypothetical protein VFO65_01700, partial [Acidimicrobiales bacterium]|nr:hypothetical protein [Acidimicrobiales bacterium]
MGALVVLAAEAGIIEPGAEAEAVVVVGNAGSDADRFDVRVQGPAAGWARVEPAELSLAPGEEVPVSVRFRPPRSPDTTPGLRPYSVVVASQGDGRVRAEATGAVEVASFTAVSASLFQVRGRRGRPELGLALRNIGNRPVDTVVQARADGRGGLVAVEPRTVVLVPGGSAQVALRRPPSRALVRRAPRRLVVSVVGADGVLSELAADWPDDVSLPAELRRTARAFALAMVVLVAGAVAVVRTEDGRRPAPTTTAVAGEVDVIPPGGVPEVTGQERAPAPPLAPLVFVRVYGPGEQDLVVRPAGAGRPELRLRAEGATESRPRLAPGGGFVAFVRESGGGWQVCVVRATGGEVVCVAEAGAGSAVAWSPDGATLYLSRAGRLYSVPYDAEAGLAGPELDLGIAVGDGAFALSPAGDRLAFVDQGDLVVQPVAPGDPGAAPVRLGLAVPGVPSDPAWSPDGGLLAFAADGHLYTVPAAGGAPQRLTEEGSDDRHPAGAPDGGWVVFAGSREGRAGL